jgi:Leucine-rich repeat (LRR) protein
LTENSLTLIENNTFSRLINLRELFLDYNEINSIGQYSFSALTKLRVLYWFKSLIRLQNLKSEMNCIKDVAPDSFSNLIGLTSLSLKGNEIKMIPSELFTELTHLIFLDLRDNLITFIGHKAFPNSFNFDHL